MRIRVSAFLAVLVLFVPSISFAQSSLFNLAIEAKRFSDTSGGFRIDANTFHPMNYAVALLVPDLGKKMSFLDIQCVVVSPAGRLARAVAPAAHLTMEVPLIFGGDLAGRWLGSTATFPIGEAGKTEFRFAFPNEVLEKLRELQIERLLVVVNGSMQNGPATYVRFEWVVLSSIPLPRK